jgi:hypothetical protein
MPYRKDPRKASETKWDRCPTCNSPEVLLYRYEYPDPHWYDDDDTYGSPPCPAPMLEGWECGLCRGAPHDPRKAVCYVGNLILKELAKIART